ncbi:MAG: hypothetical protein Fur0043_05300 [Anaerolineales bacterium]
MKTKATLFLLILRPVRYVALILLVVCLTRLPPRPVSAAASAQVTDDQPTLDFPNSITFQAVITSNSPIESVELEYGTETLTCGTVIAKAFPEFTSGSTVHVTWTWEMRQSGSLPPGATIWWQWRYKDADGAEFVTEPKTIVWLDDRHDWQVVSSDPLYLHWYSGDQAFAQDLLQAAKTGLARLQDDAGLQPEKPIHLYIYANTEDMKDAILYEPSWTGGMAFPEHDIVIIGISPRDQEWGRSTIAHELTHVLVGHLTFSCLSDVPTWLNEGLAVYSEGELDSASQNQLDQAIRNNQLLSVRSLSAGFSEVPDKAYLSYSQSYSIVAFLIKTYGQDKMTALLTTLRDGATVDNALLDTYGFDVDGLEDAWRQAVGAAPRLASAQPTAQPTPTFVPTYIPYAGAPLLVTTTPYAIPTSPIADNAPTLAEKDSSLILTIALTACCCVSFLFIGVILLIFILRARKGGNHAAN